MEQGKLMISMVWLVPRWRCIALLMLKTEGYQSIAYFRGAYGDYWRRQEPIEFLFLFVSPLLFVFHAL